MIHAIFTGIVLALSFTFVPAVSANTQCQYANTQARVQKDITDPWKESVIIGCERSFNVGSFHNGTGQFADDTTLRVTGPNGFNKTYGNGETVRVQANGKYRLDVTTNGQFGSACTQTAFAHVYCQQPEPGSCTYNSTQARVQKDITDPWKQHIAVGCGRSFNVGSFHDDTGQFAGDTRLRVTGPGHDTFYRNGDTVRVTNNGRYTLSVHTNNQRGDACRQQATVDVTCAPTPTATPTPAPQDCPYSSTQSRVQKTVNQPWQQELVIACGETFNVGSFHDHTGQFAGDTTIHVTGPYGFSYTPNNADTVRIVWPGAYTVRVVTPGHHGPTCMDESRVTAVCTIPWWYKFYFPFLNN